MEKYRKILFYYTNYQFAICHAEQIIADYEKNCEIELKVFLAPEKDF